jgi:uncharacterized protein YggU (UPF0235/DUF167 family)
VVGVSDDGVGIADIDRLGTLGSSASYEHQGNIGQFGVGAKAWMCKAAKFTVVTARDKRRHIHTFDLRPAMEAIERGTPIKRWLSGYNGSGKDHKGPSGSVVLLDDLHTDSGPISIPALIGELERRYWPALRSGIKLVIDDRRRRPNVMHPLRALEPAEWTDKFSFESSVNGRAYKATLGILTNKIGAYGGLFIGYLFRNICIEKRFVERRFPGRLHGQIELSEAWRSALSNYKDDLISDKDALLADIETQAKALIDKADDFVEDWRLNVEVASTIEGVANDALRRSLAGEIQPRTTYSRGTTTASRKRGKKRAKRRSKHEKETPQPTEAKKRPLVRGMKLGWAARGTDVIGELDIAPNSMTVTLNKECPKLEALSRQPRYPGVYLVMGHVIARHCVRNLRPYEIEEYFSGMLGDAKGSEDINALADAIELWWAFLADEQQEQAAAA